MKIEEAIQQRKPFRNNHQRALVNLVYTHNWVAERVKQYMRPYGVTPQQYNVLRILRGAGQPISTSVIRERLLYKMADASRMVDRLNQKGLVVRNVCPADKRLVDVQLSEKGEELLGQLDKIDAQLDGIFDKLTKEESVLLSDLLDKLRG